jgi:hypothetical protein
MSRSYAIIHAVTTVTFWLLVTALHVSAVGGISLLLPAPLPPLRGSPLAVQACICFSSFLAQHRKLSLLLAASSAYQPLWPAIRAAIALPAFFCMQPLDTPRTAISIPSMSCKSLHAHPSPRRSPDCRVKGTAHF